LKYQSGKWSPYLIESRVWPPSCLLQGDIQPVIFAMNRPTITVRIVIALLALVSMQLCAQETPDQEVSQLVSQSHAALAQHDEQKALSIVHDGLVRFPNDENLRIQLARIYVEQKRDQQALGLLNAILLANPSNRNAKLELAEIFGYRAKYKESDRLYCELLSDNPDDEAASVGLVHNLLREGKKAEARTELQQAFTRHPTSLELQEYSDYLTNTPAEGEYRKVHRIQNTESFFSDTSGNRSVYSSQGLVYQFAKNFTGRARVDETALWRTDTFTNTVLSGTAEGQYRLNKYVALRASLGAVRFADTSSRLLYGGDLELFPVKGLSLSGGFSRYPIDPTFDATLFDLLSEGWHGRLDYRAHNFDVSGSMAFTHYNDGNHGERQWAEALRWFPWHDGKFALAGGYAFRHIHFIDDTNHGYFSPNQYRSQLAAAGFRMRLGKHYRGEYMGYGGAEILENVSGYSPAGEVLLKNDFLFGPWDVAADYSYYHLIQTTGAFRANAVNVTFGYKF
jgi:tetratricopeptide (TPR) repeat protein